MPREQQKSTYNNWRENRFIKFLIYNLFAESIIFGSLIKEKTWEDGILGAAKCTAMLVGMDHVMNNMMPAENLMERVWQDAYMVGAMTVPKVAVNLLFTGGKALLHMFKSKTTAVRENAGNDQELQQLNSDSALGPQVSVQAPTVALVV